VTKTSAVDVSFTERISAYVEHGLLYQSRGPHVCCRADADHAVIF